MSPISGVVSTLVSACKTALDYITYPFRWAFNRTVSVISSVKTYLFGSSGLGEQSEGVYEKPVRERTVDSVSEPAVSTATSVTASDQAGQGKLNIVKFKALLTDLLEAEKVFEGLLIYLQEREKTSSEQRFNILQLGTKVNDIEKLHRIAEDLDNGVVPADAKSKVTGVYKVFGEALVLLKKGTLNALLDQDRLKKFDALLNHIDNARDKLGKL
ncbi:hypothetical protein [Endozoicomonas sp. ONNA2]|uniref:hypothetical protein n=1 Tax=Endozoicomonas sp. ONNA2 TaxID=2828741 RepID=UPI0021482603|nr:hypothetical protein [Endozoicomonas sp. ONNA2]